MKDFDGVESCSANGVAPGAIVLMSGGTCSNVESPKNKITHNDQQFSLRDTNAPRRERNDRRRTNEWQRKWRDLGDVGAAQREQDRLDREARARHVARRRVQQRVVEQPHTSPLRALATPMCKRAQSHRVAQANERTNERDLQLLELALANEDASRCNDGRRHTDRRAQLVRYLDQLFSLCLRVCAALSNHTMKLSSLTNTDFVAVGASCNRCVHSFGNLVADIFVDTATTKQWHIDEQAWHTGGGGGGGGGGRLTLATNASALVSGKRSALSATVALRSSLSNMR
jgi:hypothetical protein